MPLKYHLPAFLDGIVDQAAYQRWVERKVDAHVRRDRKRGNSAAIGEAYRLAIHAAVIASEGRDAYTGTQLDWSLLSRYSNAESADGKRTYKHKFACLPTVDHVGDGLGPTDFQICSWRVNDAKHDLDMPAFMAVCRAVLEHHGFVIEAPPQSALSKSPLPITSNSGL